MHRLPGLVVALTLIAALPSPAEAQSDQEQAMTLYAQAAARYQSGEYDTAVVLLREAIRLHDQPPFHYNLARALQELGEYEEARQEYLRFLELAPETEQRARVEERVAEIDAQIEAARVAAEEEEARRAEEAEAQRRAQAQLRPERRPETRGPEATPWILLGVSAAPLVAGVVVGAMVQGEVDAARRAVSQRDAHPHVRSAEDLAVVTNVLLAVGGALAVGSLVWGMVDVLSLGGEEESAAALRLRLGPSGAAVDGTF